MNKFISFLEAYNIVKKLNIRNTDEWRKFIKENKEFNIPYNPDTFYKEKGWISWKHFLNKEFKLDFISYDKAKKIVNRVDIKNNIDFKKWIKKNLHTKIPKAPEVTYRNKGWISWADFLETNNYYSKNFHTYKKAKSILFNLKLNSQKEYLKWIKKENINLPTNPHLIYKEEWISFSEYLNTNNISNSKKVFISYNECKKIVINKKIKSINQFIKWKQRPNDIPARPDMIYEDWISWDDFLGEKIISNKEKGEKYLSFDEAKKYLKKVELKHRIEYDEHIKKNDIDFLPKRPDYFYKKNWIGYLDYLNCEGLKSSYGELRIKKFLDDSNIRHEREKRFNTCLNSQNNKLPFDFYLMDKNICIEYDGEHHFHVVTKYGGDDFLKKVKEHDKIKTEWCKKNNINLLRIPYNKKSKIFEILRYELSL